MSNRRSLQVMLALVAMVFLLIAPTIAIGRSVIEQYMQTEVSTKGGNS